MIASRAATTIDTPSRGMVSGSSDTKTPSGVPEPAARQLSRADGWPRRDSSSTTSSTRRLLPLPAMPWNTVPIPSSASATAVVSNRSRPTNGERALALASRNDSASTAMAVPTVAAGPVAAAVAVVGWGSSSSTPSGNVRT